MKIEHIAYDPIIVEKIGGKFWRLNEPTEVEVRIKHEGTLRWKISDGFVFDFGSIPQRLQGIVNIGTADPTALAAYLVHDANYGGHFVSRKFADDLLFEMLRGHLQDRWDRWLAWVAVRAFGGAPWAATDDELRIVRQRVKFAWRHK